MKKFDNFIYYTICEMCLDLIKETNFSTFDGYCRGMKTAIELKNMGGKQMSHLSTIADMLVKIYGITEIEVGEYLHDFFWDRKDKIFVKPVLMMNEFFPECSN